MIFADATPDRWAALGQFLREDWPLLLPLALGFLAVYLLMPQAQKSWKIPGAALGALALVLVGTILIQHDFLLIEGALFYAFAGIAILAGGMMVTQRNPVHSALSFALVVLSTCGLFLLLGAPFLMAATIIVYAGAIVVTFLFVIMLAQQAGLSSADQRTREPFLACLAGFVLIAALVGVLHKNYDTSEFDRLLDRVQRVSRAKTSAEAMVVLGDPGVLPDGKGTLELVDQLHKYFQTDRLKSLAREDSASKPEKEREGMERELVLGYQDLLADLEQAWFARELPVMVSLATKIHRVGIRLRPYIGMLSPPTGLPMSNLSGAPANAPMVGDATGRGVERLPAANVAAIGRSLFTDYLIAVELAAMLLLVATIGAIVIAGRRTEELR